MCILNCIIFSNVRISPSPEKSLTTCSWLNLALQLRKQCLHGSDVMSNADLLMLGFLMMLCGICRKFASLYSSSWPFRLACAHALLHCRSKILLYTTTTNNNDDDKKNCFVHHEQYMGHKIKMFEKNEEKIKNIKWNEWKWNKQACTFELAVKMEFSGLWNGAENTWRMVWCPHVLWYRDTWLPWLQHRVTLVEGV